MHTYIHKVHYYETDKMGITHHSNYIRWMEEARMDLLQSVAYGMTRLEASGITSPVVSVGCDYKHPTTYDDKIKIDAKLLKYSGVKLEIGYVMTNLKDGKTVLTASSTHCFIDSTGRPISVKKHFPEFDKVLKDTLNADAELSV